jgi:hypothetical protein
MSQPTTATTSRPATTSSASTRVRSQKELARTGHPASGCAAEWNEHERELGKPPDRRSAKYDEEDDAASSNHDSRRCDQDIFEQDPERQQYDAERRQRVEPRERRSDKCGERAHHDEHAEDGIACAGTEQPPAARSRPSLEPAN